MSSGPACLTVARHNTVMFRVRSSSSKIIVGNVPNSVHPPDLEGLLSQFGTIQSIEKINTRDGATQTVAVIFEAPEFAQQACQELNGYEYEGSFLKVEMASERRNRNRAARGPGGMAFQGPPGASRQTDFPLRILVQSDMVGAIIGRQGTTIRQITQQTRARVDVHRKDNVGSLEKAITIYGNPENCTNACKKILEVMQQEATNTNKGEITLKVLAHNNLIGRIIGKGGNTIKRIMQETDTKITVSSINDVSSFNMERIITVKGSIENMSRAESMVSSKLRQSYENDLQAMAPQSMMFPGLHPMAMMSTSNMNYSSRGSGGFPGTPYGSGPASYQGMYPPGGAIPPTGGPPGIPGGPNDAQETTFLYIPNNAVGAIIGTKGTHIRNIIRFSGASVKIAPIENDKQPPPPPPPTQQNPGEPQPPVAERKVTIIGTPESQWKAQYLIFEKMREEGYVAGTEDVRLTVEILVPSGQVGRIIGKGGQNVRELQRNKDLFLKRKLKPQSTLLDHSSQCSRRSAAFVPWCRPLPLPHPPVAGHPEEAAAAAATEEITTSSSPVPRCAAPRAPRPCAPVPPAHRAGRGQRGLPAARHVGRRSLTEAKPTK
ncbi:hypothetical protein FOCC_FOCC000430 [Frankliniella occidentalis]|nr:hypothetical protein FOCC_FOCC000430 [Frankliniella occidentalis]